MEGLTYRPTGVAAAEERVRVAPFEAVELDLATLAGSSLLDERLADLGQQVSTRLDERRDEELFPPPGLKAVA